MSLRPVSTNRKSEADRSSLENDRKSTYTTAPTHTLSGRDDVTESLTLAETSDVHYIYYRIYAEDGAIPSKAPATPGDPFIGRIKARSVPPPHRDTVQAVKRTISKVENIKDRTSPSLFLTPYSQSPMDNADKVTALNRTASGPGSTPQDPLAFVVKMSRSALESEGRGGLGSVAEPDTTRDSEIRYLYYLLYADDYELSSKVAFDQEEPSLGRIRVDYVAPPHGPATIKRCISRVESTPAVADAYLFADISCNTPLKEDHISFLQTDYPGLSAKEPMAIVLTPLAPLAIPDGRYLIRNRAADIYWNACQSPIQTVYFWHTTIEHAKVSPHVKWDITHDTNGNISMTSPYAPSSWVGAEITGSMVPVPWRSIQADSKFYYLTTDMNRDSRNPRVPAVQPGSNLKGNALGTMANLKEGDQWQMWEFIPVD